MDPTVIQTMHNIIIANVFDPTILSTTVETDITGDTYTMQFKNATDKYELQYCVEFIRKRAPPSYTIYRIDKTTGERTVYKPQDPNLVIQELEKKGEDFIKTNKNGAVSDLMSHMSKGFDEFKEKTGRSMTYAEMRAAWG